MKGPMFSSSKKLGAIGKAYTQFRMIRLDFDSAPRLNPKRPDSLQPLAEDMGRFKFPSVYLGGRAGGQCEPARAAKEVEDRQRMSNQILKTQLELQDILNIASPTAKKLKLVRKYRPIKQKKITAESLIKYYNQIWTRLDSSKGSQELLKELANNRALLCENKVFEQYFGLIKESKARVPRYLQIVRSGPGLPAA